MDDTLERFGAIFSQLLVKMRKMRFFAGIKMRRPQAFLLLWIYENPGCGVVEIARGLNVSPPTITVGLHGLATRGFIRKVRSETDKRAKVILLTEKGKDLATNLIERRISNMKVFLEGLTEDEQETFVNLLEKMNENLDFIDKEISS